VAVNNNFRIAEFIINFLSRLCGGEFKNTIYLSNVKFLSRLCGGESLAVEEMLYQLFLSRLCGGECSF